MTPMDENTASPAPALPESGVEGVGGAIADLIDKIAKCRSENAMDEAFLDNPEEIAAAVIANLLPTPPICQECDWPAERFTVHDCGGEHDPCYVVMPDGAMIPFNHHPGKNGAGDFVDVARARFVAAACNAALATPAPAPAPAPAPVDAAGLVTEPVAWRFPKRYGYGLSFMHPGRCFDDAGNEEKVEPLYGASALAAAAEREAALVRERDNWQWAFDKRTKQMEAAEARVTAAEAEREGLKHRIEGDCHLLTMAINANDPKAELLLRVKDIAAAIRKETT